MKKIIFCLLILCLVPAYALAGDFIFDKGVSFGMTQKEVTKAFKKAKADAKVKEKSADMLVLQMPFTRDPKIATVTCFFNDKKLNAVEYSVGYMVTVSNSEIYFVDYTEIIEQLTASYGEPLEQGLHWLIADGTVKDGFIRQNQTGLAVTMGYLEGRANWVLEDLGMAIDVLLHNPRDLRTAVKVTYKPL